MKMNLVILFLLFGILETLSQDASKSVASDPSKNYYTVALFEHARKGNSYIHTPDEIKQVNLKYFMRATEIAKSKGADVIVFPEYGIIPFNLRIRMRRFLEQVPDPKSGRFNPCQQKHEFLDKIMLYNLSCIARQHNIVIVANTGDIQPCHPQETEGCPPDGSFHYNANVVFDRDGTIISKYHKEHPFFEHGMDVPTKRQDPIFTTDFGTFASFVCFDVMYKHIVETAQDSRVDAIFLPTNWVDFMPLGISVQTFQGWSMATKATIVAANGHNPSYSTLGSGVFTANLGTLIYTFNPDGASKLIVSKVPKSKEQKQPFPNHDANIVIVTANGTKEYDEDDTDFDHYLPKYCFQGTKTNKDYRCSLVSFSNFTFMKLVKTQGHLQTCNNGMCCTLDYSSERMNETYYFGVANTTLNIANTYYFCIESCLVVRCDNFGGQKCNIFPTKSSVAFQELKLKANFTTSFVQPSVQRTGMRLAPITEWKHEIEQVKSHYAGTLQYKASSKSKPLLVASLTGRCYDRDPPYVRSSSFSK